MSDRTRVLVAAARVAASDVVTPTDARLLAQGLLEIAAHSMPDTYFAEDSRCQLARAVLGTTEAGRQWLAANQTKEES